MGVGEETRRIPLPVLLVPFGIAATAGTVADWIWPKLVTDHPLVLITLSSKNRFLLLSAPQLGVIAFFVAGFLRLIFTDPVTYVLGRQYGDGAINWIERKTSAAKPGEGFVSKAQRMFGKAAWLFILIAPSALWCMLAGAARMKVWLFVLCNVAGTIGRLVLFWVAADLFRDSLESFLDGIERFQMPLIVLTVGLGIVQTIRSRRRQLEPALELEPAE